MMYQREIHKHFRIQVYARFVENKLYIKVSQLCRELIPLIYLIKLIFFHIGWFYIGLGVCSVKNYDTLLNELFSICLPNIWLKLTLNCQI